MAKKKRIRRLKRIRAIPILLFFIVLLSAFIPSGNTGFDKDSIKAVGNPEATPPKLKAGAAEIYSLDMDKAVYSKNGDKRIDPYSITKILTCYLAIENLDMDKVVTASKNATKVLEDGSSILLEEGEEMKVIDLLYGAMMVSGNDAATALGEAVAGSEDKFAEMMTKQAEDWGCTDTHFVNANGWKNKEHYTTAHDMAIITARCFENEKLRDIAETWKYVIPATNKSDERYLVNYTIQNTAELGYVNYGKTGGWGSEDCSIAVEFSKDNLNAAIVLLRDTIDKRPSDLKKLIEFSQKVTPGFRATTEGRDTVGVKVKGGEETTTYLAPDKTIYVYPQDNKKGEVKVKVETDKLTAPVKKGVKAGAYTVLVNGAEFDSGDLITTENVRKGGALSKLYISNETAKRCGTTLLVLFLLILLMSIQIARVAKK